MSATRQRRRVESRLRMRRQRRRAALGALVLIVALAIALKGSGGSSRGHEHQAAKHRAVAIVPGGPLAPAWAGGLAALWAPQNVVGTQPGTAAAYEGASTQSGPGGYVLVADRGNNRVLVLSTQGQVVFTYPTPEDLSQGRRLVYNDDTFVEPGGQSLIANEEDNHAIVRIGLGDHSLTTLFGHPGEPGSDDTHLRTPDDAYTLPDGSFTVADAYNCRILFIDAGRIVRQYGHSGECMHDPPRYFGAVNGDTPVPGGGVLVSEITGSWIDEIGPEGRLVFSVRAPVEYPSDPQPLPGGRILLADYSSPGAIVIMDQSGNVLWRYRPLQGYGRLDHPSLAMALPNGNIAVNDDYRDRVVVIDPRRNAIVWQYGHTDVPGTAPGFLNTPDGMDFIPAGPRGGPDYAAVVHP
jgi:DNA-binding beta-propeller fold protein YncE